VAVNIILSHHSFFFLLQVCHECQTLYGEARGSSRQEIVERCLKSKHVKIPGGHRCASCLQSILEAIQLQSRRCRHDKLKYLQEDGRECEYVLCEECLNTLSRQPCHHTKTELVSALDPLSWSCVLVETFGPGDPSTYPKILESRTHVAEHKEEDVMGELWKYLISIRPLVSEKWEGAFPEVEDMEMTPNQMGEYENARQCYACCGVFGEEVWRGEESYIRNKCRDHCHKTGAYR
jgi:hypothetical protein